VGAGIIIMPDLKLGCILKMSKIDVSGVWNEE
jgi:hypothetical protein